MNTSQTSSLGHNVRRDVFEIHQTIGIQVDNLEFLHVLQDGKLLKKFVGKDELLKIGQTKVDHHDVVV